MNFIFIATIIIVFFILAALLRAIVAPLYLIASVLVSYLSALGLSVIVFHLVMGQELHWSLPGLSFVCLVAVGADYNMLLISRIREEATHSVRVGVIRTVGATGGVITSAGMIFAVSMFGLMAASIGTMIQAGFTIGIGILLDTFLVRTATVPALVAIIGRASWWPHFAERQHKKSAKGPMRIQNRFSRMVGVYFRGGVDPNGALYTAASPTSAGGSPKSDRVFLDDLSFECRSGIHALPLFGFIDHPPSARRRPGSARLKKTNTGMRAEGDREFLQHALPLFDLTALISTNGSGGGVQ